MAEPPQTSLALPITALIVKILTLILLLTSLILLVTDSATFKPIGSLYEERNFRLKYIYSYRYMLSTIVIGLAYIFLQLPFTIYHVSRGKPLTQNIGLLIYFDFISDKVILCLMGTGVGAGFGATYDLKKTLDDTDDLFKRNGNYLISGIREALDDFFNMGFVSSTILLIAFLCLLASSIISSLALIKRASN